MPIKLVVTIDVEEEGLFSGSYSRSNIPISNVTSLNILDPLFREWDIRPTLLLTYHVAKHKRYHDLFSKLAANWNAEIGAHLHHWNTPPLKQFNYREPVPSEMIPRDILAAKLNHLIDSINGAGFSARSFRMGRFNMGPTMFSLLRDFGIKVDSSICPMHKSYGGPDHISAPTDPYFPDCCNILSAGDSDVLEVPVTVVPIIPAMNRYFQMTLDYKLLPENWVGLLAGHFGSFPVQPMWTGLNRLIYGARLHISRGGEVISLFFHSSELIPGGCPQHRTKSDVDRFLQKLDSLFLWLFKENNTESMTLSQLRKIYFQKEKGVSEDAVC